MNLHFLENRAAPIISNPNPLAIPSITIVRDKLQSNLPKVQSKQAIIDGIGLSLLRILKKEYGDEYREEHSVDEARQAMEKVNPHLVQRNPKEAILALKKQFRAYLDGIEPFTRTRRRNESLREYWCRFLDDDDSDVLAVG